jgi:guanylate kinase
MTTRNKRFDETEAKDYFFVSKKEFQEAIKNNELLEYAMYVNNYYGTPRKYVDDLRMQGFNVLLEIESKGALQIMDYAKKNKDKGIITIFISPPNFDELIKRLKTRGTEDAIKIKERIKQAK